jgi:hypothetical protein
MFSHSYARPQFSEPGWPICYREPSEPTKKICICVYAVIITDLWQPRFYDLPASNSETEYKSINSRKIDFLISCYPDVIYKRLYLNGKKR